MAIRGFFGVLGSGKTLTANHFMKLESAKGRRIITHADLNIPHKKLSLDEIFEKAINNTSFFRDSILFIDEFHLVVESRRSTASVNVDFSQSILIQLSKLDCDLYYTSQLLSQIDLRIKEMQKYFFFCRKDVAIQLCNNAEHQICDYDEDRRILRCKNCNKLIPFDIDLQILIFDGLKFKLHSACLPWEYCQTLFSNYKTREIIKFDRKKYLKK